MFAARYGGTDQDKYPDHTAWIPGEFSDPRALYAGPDLHIQIERAEAYPNGALISLTVRVPEPMSLEAQRGFAGEVISFHSGPGHVGPNLGYRFGATTDWTQAVPWGHGGTHGHYELHYWIPVDPGIEAALRLLFVWPGRSISERFDYSSAEHSSARDRAKWVWNSA